MLEELKQEYKKVESLETNILALERLNSIKGYASMRKNLRGEIAKERGRAVDDKGTSYIAGIEVGLEELAIVEDTCLDSFIFSLQLVKQKEVYKRFRNALIMYGEHNINLKQLVGKMKHTLTEEYVLATS